MNLKDFLNSKDFLSLIQRYGLEYLITGIFGGIQSPIGNFLRGVIYRTFLDHLGRSVKIQANVRLIGGRSIHIGDQVNISSGTYISSKGNRVHLSDRVSLDRGVDIRAGIGYDGKIEIGEETYIAPYVCMAGPGPITIGKDCMIAAHSSLYANNHIFADPNRPFRFQGITTEGIVIEDDCWLGTGVRVVDGVTIGRGSVIGAGSVVTRNIPPYSVAVGVPARVIRRRENSEVPAETYLSA
jgi:acetyltransferase-like isoleucine patch superfamily enzyme